MNEVVKYHNDLNTVAMRRWTSEEMNFFFAIIAKMRNKGTQLVEFDKYELAELAKYSIEHNQRFKDTMKTLTDKLSVLRYREETKNSLKIMLLFQRFEIKWSDDLSEMTVKIRVSEDFEYIVNKLDAQFTSFELEEFIDLKSTYSKQMYRLLKQWRTIGYKKYSKEELHELLSIPKSYKQSHVNSVVLKPIEKELSQIFDNFKIKPIKQKTRGNPIIAYEFYWSAEQTREWIDNKYSNDNIQQENKNDEKIDEEEFQRLISRLKKD